MKYFIIFLVLIGFSGTVFAIPEFIDPEKVYGADVIIIGQILSYYDEGKYRFYEISILKELKNSVFANTITMRSINENDIFETGDPVLLYLKDYGRGFWESTNFSEKILDGRLQYTINKITELVEQTEKQSPEPPSESAVTNNMLNQSPLKQIKSGITADQIQCNVGLVLIQKIDYSPVCVKSESVEKLRERGWAKLLFEIQNQPDQTNSHFNSHKIQNKFPNVAQRQVVMKIEDQKLQDGALGVTIIDKITRTESSDDVVYIEIVKQWENFKIPEPMFFNITLEGDNTPVSKPFLIQQSLMESHAGPLKDQFYFSLPINVPLFAKAEQGVILFNYTMPGILPKDDRYHLKFASFSDVEVKLPNDVIIIENNTREYSEFWSYDENYALSHKADHLTIGYPSSMDVNSVIIYDITFEIRK